MSASSTVIAANVDAGRCRNGPPEAVSQSFETLPMVARDQALVQRAVLGVDGQKPGAPSPLLAGHDLAGHDQGFLVGEGHVLARLNGGKSGNEADRAHRRRHHEIGLRGGRDRGHAGLAHLHVDAGKVHHPREGLPRFFGGDRGHLGLERGDLGR